MAINFDFDITERGNNAFATESGNLIFFAKGNDGDYLEISYTPENYPAWNIGTVSLTDKQLTEHINNRLDGWMVRKCQLDGVNISRSNEVIGTCTIADEVVDSLTNGYIANVTSDRDELLLVVKTELKELGYGLTDGIIQETLRMLENYKG